MCLFIGEHFNLVRLCFHCFLLILKLIVAQFCLISFPCFLNSSYILSVKLSTSSVTLEIYQFQTELIIVYACTGCQGFPWLFLLLLLFWPCWPKYWRSCFWIWSVYTFLVYSLIYSCNFLRNSIEEINFLRTCLSENVFILLWLIIFCGKFWKRWEYQTTWPASWEICMQVRKQQLELDMEQQTGSK